MSAVSSLNSPELHRHFQRAVWAPRRGQTEAVHPEPGHPAAEPRGQHGGHNGAQGGLPLLGATDQPPRGHPESAGCLRHGKYEDPC